MYKAKVVRGAAILAISTGLSLWNMESQEVVALAPVNFSGELETSAKLWENNLPQEKNKSMKLKMGKLKKVRKVHVREHRLAVKRAKEEAARKRRMKQIQACCGVRVSDTDRSILERIVQAEAGDQDHAGKLLVANVILNRVRSSKFPSTIRGVVFSPRQFSPISDGSYARAVPSRDTKKAVDEALHGVDGSHGALYFMDRRYSSSSNVSWFDRSLTRLFQHQGHEFYR